MNDLQIVALSPSAPIACWSMVHRCFVGRSEQVLMIATRVFGTRKHAERWLHDPAYGLGWQVPCDMLSKRLGYEDVDRFLNQIEHGVYV